MTGHDALALVELDSIARGYRALDALVKRSPVKVLEANLIEPGRYLILFTGGVAEVDEGYAACLETGCTAVTDRMMLPMAHTALLTGLSGGITAPQAPDTLGIVEGLRVPTTLRACDRSLKDAWVELAGIRVAGGLGGKAYYVVHGVQHDVEAALDAAREILGDHAHRLEMVPRPHPEMVTWLLRPAPFRVGSL